MQLNFESACLGVFKGVGQRFLGDPDKGMFPGRAYLKWLTRTRTSTFSAVDEASFLTTFSSALTCEVDWARTLVRKAFRCLVLRPIHLVFPSQRCPAIGSFWHPDPPQSAIASAILVVPFVRNNYLFLGKSESRHSAPQKPNLVIFSKRSLRAR
jgi:hypothetical protein